MPTPSLELTDPSHAAAAEKLPPAKLPRQLSDAEYDLFHAVGRQRAVSPGETIFRKGELGRSMFVIETCEIHLEFGDGLPHKLIGPREFVGELALFIGDHMRVASAIAKRRSPTIAPATRRRARRLTTSPSRRVTLATRSPIRPRA